MLKKKSYTELHRLGAVAPALDGFVSARTKQGTSLVEQRRKDAAACGVGDASRSPIVNGAPTVCRAGAPRMPQDGRLIGLRERLCSALSSRLYPNSSLHRKVLADAIGVSRDSLDNWFRGAGEPRAELLGALIRFFWDRGDRDFLWEVLAIDPPRVVPLDAARAAARAVAELNTLLTSG